MAGKANIAALGGILTSLIEKRYKLSRNFGIQDLSYWSEEAIKFLFMIMDAGLKELVLYLFFKQAKALDLVWFTIYALRNV